MSSGNSPSMPSRCRCRNGASAVPLCMSPGLWGGAGPRNSDNAAAHGDNTADPSQT